MSTPGASGLEAAFGEDSNIAEDIFSLTPAEIRQRTSVITNESRILRSDINRLDNELKTENAYLQDNTEKIKLNKGLPWLVANIVEVLEEDEADEEDPALEGPDPEEEQEEEIATDNKGTGTTSSSSSSSSSAAADTKTAGNTNNGDFFATSGDIHAQNAAEEKKRQEEEEKKKKKAHDLFSAGAHAQKKKLNKKTSVIVKTTTRQTIYLPVPGLVPVKSLKPGDLVGTNKDSYLILDHLPSEYDPRVKAMELDEKPTEDYSDVGGCDKQIQELVEAVVLPMTHADRFKALGIRPPKGVLLHGPPGTGKTLLARACAKSTNAVFLKLAGPSLVQMYIGDGAKMVRDAFELAKEKAKDKGGAIIFIDEIDAIGTKRSEGEGGSDREVTRTMLELLNQLDGFTANEKVKVIAATNRPDTLDPALLRSGRLDRKVELPLPDEKSRVRIMQIHCRKMNVDENDVNFEELARSTDDFNGAMLKAVCVEAGMCALRREGTIIKHEDFVEGIQAVQMKKKSEINYMV